MRHAGYLIPCWIEGDAVEWAMQSNPQSASVRPFVLGRTPDTFFPRESFSLIGDSKPTFVPVTHQVYFYFLACIFRHAIAPAVVPFHSAGGRFQHVIAIGSSTGGVEALREIFLRLPANCPPIVITQHMPETFTKSFAARLDSLSQVSVSEAANHARLKEGHAYIAPGGHCHLKLVKIGADFVCKLEEGAPVSGHWPSVDVLFYSVSETVGARAVGIILTGMGKDGAEGMKAMRDKGAYNIGQNQATCVIYGMPQMAAKAGATHIELPLADIPAAVLKFCEKVKES